MSNPWDIISRKDQLCQMDSIYDFDDEGNIELVDIEDFIKKQTIRRSEHNTHEVVENQVLGKKFLYCRDCKKEVE